MKYETIPNLKMGMGTTSTALEKATVALEKVIILIMWASNAIGRVHNLKRNYSNEILWPTSIAGGKFG